VILKKSFKVSKFRLENSFEKTIIMKWIEEVTP